MYPGTKIPVNTLEQRFQLYAPDRHLLSALLVDEQVRDWFGYLETLLWPPSYLLCGSIGDQAGGRIVYLTKAHLQSKQLTVRDNDHPQRSPHRQLLGDHYLTNNSVQIQNTAKNEIENNIKIRNASSQLPSTYLPSSTSSRTLSSTLHPTIYSLIGLNG
jgi:hypothetical protein